MLDTLATWSSTAAALFGIVIAFPLRGRATAEDKSQVETTATAATPHKRLTFLSRFKREKPVPAAPLRIPRTVLTPAQHFSRVAQLIHGAVQTSEFVSEVQNQARIQLEVVEFSIDRILEEVGEVMTLPATLRPRLVPVSVPARALRHAA